jgi:hypothetical protein
VGLQRKFNLNVQDVTLNYREIALNGADLTQFLIPAFDSTLCQCDNVLLEAHYTVYFSDLNQSSYGKSFKIDNITVDTIYGKLVGDPTTCATQLVSQTRKSSWTFKQSIYSRKNSGGPGYLPGAKLLTGTPVQI